MAVITRCLQKTKVPAGEMIFTSSQIWTVPRGVKKVDVFLVGAGGGCGRDEYTSKSENGVWTSDSARGGRGGSGYTYTYKNINITPNSNINITVGLGGLPRTNGGSSSFGSYSVLGGYAGVDASSPTSAGKGGNGGSGGGGGGYRHVQRLESTGETIVHPDVPSGTGGVNGGNGGSGRGGSGIGQGTTTRAFGEVSGDLYAYGGGSDIVNFTNSGNGATTSNGSGADGIVIVRWEEQ